MIEEVLQALFKFKRDISFPAVRCFSIDSVILDLASRACYFSFSLSGFMLCVEYRNIDVLCLFSELKSKHHMKITEDAEAVLDNYIDTKNTEKQLGDKNATSVAQFSNGGICVNKTGKCV